MWCDCLLLGQLKCLSIFQSFSVRKINAQNASLRSLVAAENTLQQPMQLANDYPLFLCEL